MTSSSSSDCSSSSSEEDSRFSTARAQAKGNRDASEGLTKRKAEADAAEDRFRRRARIDRRVAAAEEKVFSRVRAEGVPSDSDASEDESVWGAPECDIKPDRFTREIEKLARDDPEAERDEEEGWDAYEEVIHPDFLVNSDADSDDEREDDSEKSDNSDEPNDSDEESD